MSYPISLKEWKILSEYVDGQLNRRETHQIEQRIQDVPDLQQGLDDLKKVKLILRQLPERSLPRNFMLTPDMVGIKPAGRLYPGLRLATVLASILLVFTFVGDFALDDFRSVGLVLPGGRNAEISVNAVSVQKEVSVSPYDAKLKTATPELQAEMLEAPPEAAKAQAPIAAETAETGESQAMKAQAPMGGGGGEPLSDTEQAQQKIEDNRNRVEPVLRLVEGGLAGLAVSSWFLSNTLKKRRAKRS